MTTKRKRYTKEFKLEAVRLLEAGDKPAAGLARELGVQRITGVRYKLNGIFMRVIHNHLLGLQSVS